MIEGLQLSIPQRMSLARLVLTVTLIISVLLSFNLWFGSRSFPCAPFNAAFFTDSVPTSLLTGLMLLLMVTSLFIRWQRLILFFSLLIMVWLVLADLNRLQPWLYCYVATLLLLILYNGRVDNSNKFTSYFILLQIILASVYFFCGLSQLNSWFVDTEFAEVISPLKNVISERQFLFFKRCGAVAPYFLMFIGLGLIITPIRYLAITAALLLHTLLVVFLFPSARNQNYALWFSNLAFVALTLLLFSGKTKQRYFSPAFLFQVPLFYLVIILFVVLPFFNQRSAWPDYLSFNFKSGKNKTVDFKIGPALYEELPFYPKAFCVPYQDGYLLEYDKWCHHELNVACFPEKPVFNSIYIYLRTIKPNNTTTVDLALAEQ